MLALGLVRGCERTLLCSCAVVQDPRAPENTCAPERVLRAPDVLLGSGAGSSAAPRAELPSEPGPLIGREQEPDIARRLLDQADAVSRSHGDPYVQAFAAVARAHTLIAAG